MSRAELGVAPTVSNNSRQTTPTLRASVPGGMSQFRDARDDAAKPKKRSKLGPSMDGYVNLGRKGSSPPTKGLLGLSLNMDDALTPTANCLILPQEAESEPASPVDRSREPSISSRTSELSLSSAQSEMLALSTELPNERATTPTPSFVTTSSQLTDTSLLTDVLVTPASSRAPSVMHPDAKDYTVLFDGSHSQTGIVSPQPRNWVGSFGKMAKAVVNTGVSMGMSFADKRRKEGALASPRPSSAKLSSALPVVTKAEPISGYFEMPREPRPTHEELEGLSQHEVQQRMYAWAAADHARITECARLCSQWPQSGYNCQKFGPNGSRMIYEPQSLCNTQTVVASMQRQAELEHYLQVVGQQFFPAQRRSSSASSESTGSIRSSNQASPTSAFSVPSLTSSVTTLATVPDEETAEAEARRLRDLKAAMASPLVAASFGEDGTGRSAHSYSELNSLASSLLLSSKDDASVSDKMDVDEDVRAAEPRQASPSCPAKRPFGATEADEEALDQAMVVQEGVETGVIAVPTSQVPVQRVRSFENAQDQAMGGVASRKLHSASVPDLATSAVPGRIRNAAVLAPQPQAAVFGHVVKTSDTHPIIISPFIPAELMDMLARNLVIPPHFPLDSDVHGDKGYPYLRPEAAVPDARLPYGHPVMLSSRIDVPTTLLSYQPAAAASHRAVPVAVPNPVVAVSAVSPSTAHSGRTFGFPWRGKHGSKLESPAPAGLSSAGLGAQGAAQSPKTPEPVWQGKIGNVLLSSCPGKRLRMEGPVKGRSPVCRDLTTDLRRIKNEGVGCLVWSVFLACRARDIR